MLVASIGPFWDANETWLVLGIGILLVAFPKAHGLVLGELYLPVALHADRPDRCAASPSTSASRPRTATRRPGTACSSPARRSPPISQGWMLGRYVSGFGDGWNYPLFAAAIAARAADGLRADGRLLADHEDRRRAAGEGDRHGRGSPGRRSSPAWC